MQPDIITNSPLTKVVLVCFKLKYETIAKHHSNGQFKVTTRRSIVYGANEDHAKNIIRKRVRLEGQAVRSWASIEEHQF